MYVVTGAAGFIGSRIVKELNRQGITDIAVVDDLTNGEKFKQLKELEFERYYDATDLHKSDIKGVRKVFHTGGISSTVETNGRLMMQRNYEDTIQWARYSAMRDIPMVYTSSASVYGNSTTFCETDPVDPLNVYAYSKAMSEQAIAKYDNIWTFRPFNVYGAGEDYKGDQASPISKFAKQQREHGYVEVFEGSQTTRRDFICVDDIVRVMVNYTHTLPGVYNLGTGSTETFYNIASYISDDVREIPFPEHLVGKYQYYSCANTDKLRTLIGDYEFVKVKDFVSTR
jgi:ADP-L-glycero-D-manno-heptose 6-epimerase